MNKKECSSFVFDEKTSTIINYLSKVGGNNVIIPSVINGLQVKTLGENSFRNKDIDKVFIPKSVEKISAHAFSNSKIKSIEFSDGIKEIGDCAFSNNIINNLRLPDSIIRIGKNAFSNSFISGELILPESLETVGEYAFKNNNIKYVEVNSNIDVLGDSRIFEKNMLDKVKFGKQVTMIPEYMFASCLLKEIEFADTIKEIRHHAFANNLIENVTLPQQLEKLADYAFSLNKLVDLVIPNSVEFLGKNVVWIQNYKVNNTFKDICNFDSNKITMNLSKLSQGIDASKISNLTFIIRKSVLNIIEMVQEKNILIIQVNSDIKNYIEASLDDVCSITYDYKISNANIQSKGCNTVNLIFSINELNKLINRSI